jgi:hypothetical protein
MARKTPLLRPGTSFRRRAVPALQFIGKALHAQVARRLHTTLDQLVTKGCVACQTVKPVDERSRVTWRERKTIHSVFEKLGRSTHRGTYDGCATRHGLYGHEAERLLPDGREDQGIGSAVVPSQLRTRTARELHSVGKTEFGRKSVQLLQITVVTPPHDLEGRTWRARSERPQCGVDSLSWVDSSYIEQTPTPRPVVCRVRKVPVLDSRVHDA